MFRYIKTLLLGFILIAGLLPISASAQGIAQNSGTIYLPISLTNSAPNVATLQYNDDATYDGADIEDYPDLEEYAVAAAGWGAYGGQKGYHRRAGSIVIANRASGTISVIDVATDEIVDTLTLPGDNPEPMYVNYSRAGHQVFVGDRANNQVVAYDADDFSVVATIPAGQGVFHMWANLRGKQLWVNNDIDNTITVIDTRSNQVIETVALPADLVAQGGKPHDVVISENGRQVFVSMVGFAGDNDYIVKYNARTFKEKARAAVGKDPHVSVSRNSKLLYVPTQDGNEVTVLRQRDLSVKASIPVPAAHGAGMRTDGRFLYATNIAGGGEGGLVTMDIYRRNANTVIGTTDTPFATPHNIAVTNDGSKVYVTHSGGTSDQVSVYSASKRHPVPVLVGTVTVELNPFGLDFVP